MMIVHRVHVVLRMIVARVVLRIQIVQRVRVEMMTVLNVAHVATMTAQCALAVKMIALIAHVVMMIARLVLVVMMIVARVVLRIQIVQRVRVAMMTVAHAVKTVAMIAHLVDAQQRAVRQRSTGMVVLPDRQGHRELSVAVHHVALVVGQVERVAISQVVVLQALPHQKVRVAQVTDSAQLNTVELPLAFQR
jgi:hypothetical protein